MKPNRKLLEEWRALGEYNSETRRCILPEEWRELFDLALKGLLQPDAARPACKKCEYPNCYCGPQLGERLEDK